MKRLALGVITLIALPLALTGCGKNEVTITMTAESCDVSDTTPSSGKTNLKVVNEVGQDTPFVLTENEGEGVAEIMVATKETKTVTVTFHDDDVYHPQCGDLMGSDIKPH